MLWPPLPTTPERVCVSTPFPRILFPSHYPRGGSCGALEKPRPVAKAPTDSQRSSDLRSGDFKLLTGTDSAQRALSRATRIPHPLRSSVDSLLAIRYPIQRGNLRGKVRTVPTSLLILGTLAVVSGFIAYVGDVTGKRLGKRRVMLFGLRPRQTATLISVTTGVLIVGVSIGVLSTASRRARQALFAIDKLTRQQTELRGQNDVLNKSVAKLLVESESLGREVSSLRAQRDQEKQKAKELNLKLGTTRGRLHLTHQQLAHQQRQVKAANQHLRESTARVRDLDKQIQGLTAQLNDTEKRRDEATARLHQAQAKLEQVQNQYEQAKQQHEQTAKKLAEAEEQLGSKTQDLKQVNDQLTGAKKELQKTQQERDKTVETLMGEGAKLIVYERQVRELEAEVEEAVKKRDALLEQTRKLALERQELIRARSELERQRTEIAKRLTEYVVGNVAYETGEVVASRVVDGAESAQEVRRQLVRLLDLGSEASRARGAAPPKEGQRAVELMTKKVEVGGQDIYYQEDYLLDFTAEHIHRLGESFLVELVAVITTLRDEQVKADFRLTRNRRLFEKGEVLVREKVRAGSQTADLYQALVGMLEKVKAVARDRGLHAGQSGGFGQISTRELFDTIETIQHGSGKPSVSIVVQKDTWTADPLEISFKVKL